MQRFAIATNTPRSPYAVPCLALAALSLLASACTDRPRQAAAPEPPQPAAVPARPEDQLTNARNTLVGSRALGPLPENKRLVPLGTEQPGSPPGEASANKSLASRLAHDGLDFLGRPEGEILERLRTSEIESASKGTSGRTLAFKLELADGGEAYFKPEQKIAGASWSAEVAAHHLDRALALGRVPPVVARRFAWSTFAEAASGDPRVDSIVRERDGSVRGALIHWLPNKLVPAQTPPGWESWLGQQALAPTQVSPYQRPSAYTDALKAQAARDKRAEPAQVFYANVPEPTRPALPAELSDMIVFDYLTLNVARFGDDNANVLTLGAYGPLVFLDNGAAFDKGPAPRELIEARLAPVNRFRRRTIDALRALDVKALGKRMESGGVGPLLDRAALQGLEARQKAVLQHVTKQVQRFGEAAVFPW